jgi:hypothetical protein
VTSLIRALSCRLCRPNAPFAELVRLSRTTPEQVDKDPALLWHWREEIDMYYTLEALEELLEEQRKDTREKIVGLLRGRSRQLAERERLRRNLRLVVDNTE